MDTLANQDFYYLGKGRQLFAFVGADGQTVLKFFRFDKLEPRFWTKFHFWPLNLLGKNHHLEKERKKQQWINSFELGFSKLKNETGLIAIHFDQTGDLKKQVTLIDKLGQRHLVNLDNTFFLLQKKCDPLTSTLKELKDPKEIRDVIDSFLSVVAHRYQQQIENKTRRCLDNMGLVGMHIVEFDMGEFVQKSQEWQDLDAKKSSFLKFTDGLASWLEKEKPDYVNYFLKKRDTALTTILQDQSQTNAQTMSDPS